MVQPDVPTLTVTATPNPSNPGQDVELDAKLYFDPINGTQTPTGTVQFVDQSSGQNLEPPVDLSTGTIGYDGSGEYVQVPLTTTALASGFHQIVELQRR